MNLSKCTKNAKVWKSLDNLQNSVTSLVVKYFHFHTLHCECKSHQFADNQRYSKWNNNSYLRKISDAQNKADTIENVWFTTAIKTCHSIEQRVKATDLSTLCIRLETIQRNSFNKHGNDEVETENTAPTMPSIINLNTELSYVHVKL